MRNYKYIFMALLTSALCATACTEDDSNVGTSNGKTPVTIGSMTVTGALDTSGSNHAPAPGTRATNTETGSFGWQTGDLIKVTATPTDAAKTPTTYTSLYIYTEPADKESAGIWQAAKGEEHAGNLPLYRENVDGAGEYTFRVETWGGKSVPQENAGTNGEAALAKDQGDAAKYIGSDYIYGPATLEKGGVLTAIGTTPLSHRTVDVVVTIRRGLWNEADATQSNNEFTDRIRNATLRLFSTDGADVIPYIRFGIDEKDATRATAIVRAHIPVQFLPGKQGEKTQLLTMALQDGRTLTATYTRPNTELTNGKQLVVRVDYDNLRGLSPLSATIEDWKTSIDRDEQIHVANVATGNVNNAEGSNDYTPVIGDALLIESAGLEGGKATFSYQTVACTPQWSLDAPAYWDYKQSGTSDFHALLTPAAQAVGDSEQDLLQASLKGVAIGKDLSFDQMKHAMAKVTLTLTPGGDFTPADLMQATVQWKGIKKLEELKPDGTLTLANTASDVSLNNDNGTFTLLIAPQELTSASPLSVTNGEDTYQIALNNLTGSDGKAVSLKALEGGKQYLIKAIFHKSTSEVTLDVAGWTTQSSTIPIVIAKIGGISGVNASESYTPAADDKLYLFSDQMTSGDKEQLDNATYICKIANGNTFWTSSSNQPVYWKPEQNDYSFVACIVPAIVPQGNAEKDYLYGKTFTKDGVVTSPDLEYGDKLQFPVVHAMSRMTVKLAAGKDVTIDELKKAKLSWHNMIPTESVTPSREGYLVKMSKTPVVVTLQQQSGDNALTFDVIVAPQDLDISNHQISITLGTRDYQIDLTQLKAKEDDQTATAALHKLEPAKHYVITSVMSRAESKVTMDVSPWTEAGNSNGRFDYNGYHKVN